MRTKRKSRLLSLGLCLCMLLGILPMSGMIYAVETPCPNHPSHTAECGYAEAVEGAPCKHIEAGEHDDNCGYTAARWRRPAIWVAPSWARAARPSTPRAAPMPRLYREPPASMSRAGMTRTAAT